MSWLFYAVVLGVLAIYLLAFGYETVLSFWRLRRTPNGRAGYVDATWEVTHTLIVYVFTLFMITYSSALPDLAPSLFWPVLLTGVFLLTRAGLYLYIFYIRPAKRRVGLADYGFALSHLLILVGLLIAFVVAVSHIIQLNATPNLAYFGPLLPGLAVTLLVSVWPLWRLYRQS